MNNQNTMAELIERLNGLIDEANYIRNDGKDDFNNGRYTAYKHARYLIEHYLLGLNKDLLDNNK